MGELVGLI